MEAKTDVVLVTGATGQHGGAVARALLAAGVPTRVLTRDPGSEKAAAVGRLGAELAEGELTDVDSLAAAMAGVSTVYGVTTPFGAGADAEIAQGRALIAESERAGVGWLILASVASADRQTRIPHFESKWAVEQLLRESSVDHTVVAPTYFFQNLGDLGSKVADGGLALAIPGDVPLQQIDLADIGAVVAVIIGRRDEFVGQRIEMASDQPTPQQMVAALSAAANRTLAYSEIPLDQIAARSADLAAMYRFLGSGGYSVDIPAFRARFPGIAFRSFADWAAGELRPA